MFARQLQYPIGILAAGIVLGATATTFGRNPVWPILIGLAAVVLATLAMHVHSLAAAASGEEGKSISAQGWSIFVATALIIGGIAVLLGTCAPHDLRFNKSDGFLLWVGWAALLMGAVLSYAVRLVERPRLNAQITLLRGRKSAGE